MERIMIKIAKEEDRALVAGALVKTGYSVRQLKVKRAQGNAYDYFIEAVEESQISEVKNDG